MLPVLFYFFINKNDMTKEELIHKIKVKMEELSPFGYEQLDAYQLANEMNEDNMIKPINSYVEECLVEGCNETLMLIPPQLIKPISYIGNGVLITEEGDGVLSPVSFDMGEDFLKLHSLRMSDWKTDIYETISKIDMRYKLQSNIWTMGKPTRPVVVIDSISNNDIKPRLIAYSSSNANYKTFNYIKKITEETTDFDDDLTEFFSLYIAGKVYDIMSMKEQSQVMMEEITNRIKIL